MTKNEICEVYKALGDPTRLGIVELLVGKEICVCEIAEAFNKSQPAISHHLKILKQAGLLNEQREGKWIMYSLDAAIAEELTQFTAGLVSPETLRIQPKTGCVC